MATRLDPEAGYPNNLCIFIIFLIIIISDGELFIVLEDDTELSPLWYRAMVNMWQRSGISRQKILNMVMMIADTGHTPTWPG